METALATRGGHRYRARPGHRHGAIALALASERPLWTVTAVDRVEEAVALAERNRQRLLLENVEVPQPLVLRPRWPALPDDRRQSAVYPCQRSAPSEGDVRFEPKSALVAGSDGLDDIRQIVAQAPRHLLDEGWLLLEHGYDQGAAVRELLGAAAWVHTLRDLGGNERITRTMGMLSDEELLRRAPESLPEAQPRTDRRSGLGSPVARTAALGSASCTWRISIRST